MTTSVENNNKTKDIKIGNEGENNLNKQFHQEKYMLEVFLDLTEERYCMLKMRPKYK